MQAAFTLGLFIVEQLLRRAPELFIQFQEIVAKKDVTADEIRARRQAMEEQRYEQLVPHSEIPT